MSATETIRARLFALQDEKYRDFTEKLTPGANELIGVRLPDLRALAKELYGTDEAAEFLADLPHRYQDEYHLHGFLISRERDFDRCVAEIDALLPYINNWATCDTLNPTVFKKHPDDLLPHIERWIKSDHIYTARFAILCLMRIFLDDRFERRYCDMVAAVPTDEYYLHMAVAWYFATALAKQYDTALCYLTERRLSPRTHNKTIQKAVESYRVSDEHKAYLRTLRIK